MSSFSQVAKTLPLPFAPTLQAAIRQPARKPLVRPPLENTRTKPLWLAIELPQLGLEAICHKQNSPVIVSEEARGRVLVSVANAVARQYGIHAGMPVNAAWALCPELQVAMREHSKEIIKLHELAKVIYGYSSVISVQPPNLLLVEIRASLRLFGGLDSLVLRIKQAIQQAGHTMRHGIAPSVAGARLLAFAGDSTPVLQTTALASQLGRLPLAVIGFDLPNLLPRLQKLGLRQLADLFRLPRAGLRRRFGAELILWMDRALGQRPEAPKQWQPPLHYRSEQDLDDPLSVSTELLPVIEHLLQAFCAWMRARSLHCKGFALHFYHHRQPATRLKLELLRSTSQNALMFKLLDLRMQREQLKASVIGLRLDSLRLTQAEASNTSLWKGEQGSDTQWWQALEGLQAKLGRASIQSLACATDLRPELAWQPTGINAPGGSATRNRRPAWLLAQPRRLRPQELTHLQIDSRPERIYNGWWGDQPVQRDYFSARLANQHLWIYRCAIGWFIHGIYE